MGRVWFGAIRNAARQGLNPGYKGADGPHSKTHQSALRPKGCKTPSARKKMGRIREKSKANAAHTKSQEQRAKR